MPSIGSSFFILGLVVASVTADVTPAVNGSSADLKDHNNTMSGSNNITSSAQPAIAINISGTTSMPAMPTTGSTTDINSTIRPLTTKKSVNGSSNDGQGSNTTTSKATPKPLMTTTTTPTTTPTKTKTTTTKGKDQSTATTQPKKEPGDSTGIIILVVIIIVALAFAVACYVSRKRGRRYSVDFASRQDEANIPLSTVEPVEAAPQNGLQTFENSESATKEPKEEEKEEAKAEEQVEQKAEADKSAVDPSAESAAPAPSPESAEGKPKEDVVEPSPPPAPVEPSVEDKTDDEGAVSSKTSVESLKETNENNSNNTDLSQHRDLKSGNLFWDVPLNCPV